MWLRPTSFFPKNMFCSTEQSQPHSLAWCKCDVIPSANDFKKKKKWQKQKAVSESIKNLSLYTGKKIYSSSFFKMWFWLLCHGKTENLSYAASTQDGTLSLSLIIIHNVHKTKYAIIPVLWTLFIFVFWQ